MHEDKKGKIGEEFINTLAEKTWNSK